MSTPPTSTQLTLTRHARYAPTIDLVLLSHGDLQHSGLYAYAYAHWGLTAPAYTTLPVQAMARIAATEDVEGIRDEQEIGDSVEKEKSAAPEASGSADQEMDTSPEASGSHEHKSTSPEGNGSASPEDHPDKATTPPSNIAKRRYIATLSEVHDAFDSVNVLRYSQPCHLQGIDP